jgi:hypothetical protein
MYQSGLQSLAYGGVPGQAYTEDIGMMGGLGAVAGPQLRFAYGGVPGQAYTEDIGMMGGLGAVAGPQLRFQKAGEVEGESGGGISGWLADKMEDSAAYDFFRKGRANLGMPETRDDVYGESTPFNEFRTPSEKVQHWWETSKPGHAVRGFLNPDVWTMAADPTGGYSKDILENPERLKAVMEGKPQPKLEEEVEVETQVTGETVDELGGEDPYLGEGYTGEEDIAWGADETITQDDAPKEVKKKEAVQKEKWGPNWRLMGIGMNLMRGTEAGMKDASALIAKMPTPQDKILAKLKLDYMKMRTEKGRAETSGKWMERVFDMQYKTVEQRRKARKQLHELSKVSLDHAVKIFENMDVLQKSDLMAFSEDQEKAIEKNPNLKGYFIKKNAKKIMQSFRPEVTLAVPEAPPEEDPTLLQSILGDYHPENLFKAGGGDIPEPLRQLGVSSIRKI